MLYVHRLIALIAGLIVLYIAITGTLLQSIDLQTLLTHAPATDANLQAMREHIDGPNNYAVITAFDYTARPLPVNFDYQASLRRLSEAAHTSMPGAALRLFE